MTNTELRNGATLQEDSTGRIYEPKENCKICLGQGLYRGVKPQDYSKENWQEFIQPMGCTCVKIWTKANEYDKFHPTLQV